MNKLLFWLLALLGAIFFLAACGGDDRPVVNHQPVLGSVSVLCDGTENDSFEEDYQLHEGKNTFGMRQIPLGCDGRVTLQAGVDCEAEFVLVRDDVPYGREKWNLSLDPLIEGNITGGVTTVTCSYN